MKNIQLLPSSVGVVLYVLVGLALGKTFDTGFWIGFGVTVALRIGFWVIDSIPEIIAWRSRRPTVIDSLVEFLAINRFPLPEANERDYFYYIGRVGGSCDIPAQTRNAAVLAESFYGTTESAGIVASFRIRGASDEALRKYRLVLLAADKLSTKNSGEAV